MSLLFNYLLSESRIYEDQKITPMSIITNEKTEISEIHKSVPIRDSDEL